MSLRTKSSTRERSLADLDYDAKRVRGDFPIFGQHMHGHRLVYLDSAASAQKPRAVLDAVRHCYEAEYANIHRGVYWLSEQATTNYEAAREKVRSLLNAEKASEIVFVRGATEAINLVAHSFGRTFLEAGDEVLITHLEHHSNIVPWQILRDQIGIKLVVAPIDDDGDVDFEQFASLIGPRTKLIAIAQVANALGTVLPVAKICALARERGIKTLIDGCQAVPHATVDVRAIGCDFYVFSGHKFYGPTGIGVLYGRQALLEAMPPYQGGGDMIRSVTFEHTEFTDPPNKFEAGTPNIAGAIGLGAAVDYVQGLGLDRIEAHETELMVYGMKVLAEFPGLRLIGTASRKSGVISFVLDDAHPHDIGTVLDRGGVAVRTGHHCAQPVMDRFGVPATVRVSFGMYNTVEDIDVLVENLERVREMFGR